ncbi:ATP-binding protein [Lentzea flava]|uniref:LuxR family transcriptional regulator n=1 Tax=Lentzea flava TaxID=103732 RepID=A0ABQ2UEK8_9PSEU|nr:LuxR C-terminal-related transcriptional regulator [Lentzea flava]MCP2197839.1 putative ATPase [Lentzea flava]GGU22823.1 LuxR family transcriptional regulator [Lentzea flava]
MWSPVSSRTRLVGRERKLAAARRLLRKHRLVTLTGPGGAGKSRLAAELCPAEPGTVVVELESVHRPDLLWHVVAFPLNVWDEPLRETVVAALADHRLLVLDNCEHLLSEACEVVTELLARCPRLRVLVTSREPLDVAGEMCVEVGPLSPGDARALFVECGGSAEMADSVLDHLPLAIELAAARTDVPARHRTLDAVIRWSYDLLSPAEQAALRRLCALIGDFGLDLASAVCACPGDVVRLMGSLRAKSLVVRSHSSSGARFRVLESIRLFGLARLDECGETGATVDRLVTALTRMIRMVAAAPSIGTEANAWLSGQEHQLLHALARLPRTDPRHTWLVAGIVHVWYLRGSYREAFRLAFDTLAFGSPSDHSEMLLFRTAWLAGFTGDGEESLRFAEALVAHPATRQPNWEARAWNTLGYARTVTDDLDGAREANERSVACARALNDEALLMTFLNNHAWLLMRLGDLDGASAAVEESLAFRIPDGYRLMAIRHTAGVIALERGDVDLAERHFTIALREGAPSSVALAGVLEGLGVVAARRHQSERAVVLMAAAAATRTSRQEAPWKRMVADACDFAVAEVGERRASRARRRGERLDHAGLLEYVSRAEREEPLTVRQQQIADLVVEGLTNPEIAARLGISTGTVRSHVTQMLARLGLTSRTQLAARTARAR